MSITITVSEKTESKLRELAQQSGKDLAEVAVDIIERNIGSKHSKGRKNLSDMAGMFSSGVRDTAKNASEILRAELGKSSRGK